jgi:GMP synthase-like glutamine amidotransferase
MDDPKMRFLRDLTAEVIGGHGHGVLGVCLGHELIAAELGLEIVRKEVPYQGAQTGIDLFGRAETVGFYNSFVAHCDEETAAELSAHGIEVSRTEGGEVHALRGPGFAGVQFHPESVLTLNGTAVVRELGGGPARGRIGGPPCRACPADQVAEKRRGLGSAGERGLVRAAARRRREATRWGSPPVRAKPRTWGSR